MFEISLVNVLVTLFYIIPGFTICKMRKASANHLPTLSAVLIYIGTPFLEVKTFLAMRFSWSDVREMGLFFVATFALMILFMLIVWAIFRRKYAESKYRILTMGSVMGNVGFFGIPIINALFPENPIVTCYAATFMVSMNILVFTVGVFCISGDKKYISLKSAILNPTVLGFFVAFPLYCMNAADFLPDALVGAIGTVGSMTAPLCMFILGIRLASTPIKKIFGDPMVYAITACKLLIFPLFSYAAVYFLPLSEAFKASILVLSSVPCAAVINSLAEMYDGDKELSANCILVSTVLCVVTIPVLTLLL